MNGWEDDYGCADYVHGNIERDEYLARRAKALRHESSRDEKDLRSVSHWGLHFWPEDAK